MGDTTFPPIAAPAAARKRPQLAVLSEVAAQQSRRPLSTIKDRGRLLLVAKQKSNMLTAVLKALKEKVAQQDAHDEREEDAKKKLRSQATELKAMGTQCGRRLQRCPPVALLGLGVAFHTAAGHRLPVSRDVADLGPTQARRGSRLRG